MWLLTWYKEGPEISVSDCRNGVERKKTPAWKTMMIAPCSFFPAADLTFFFPTRVDGLIDWFGRDLRKLDSKNLGGRYVKTLKSWAPIWILSSLSLSLFFQAPPSHARTHGFYWFFQAPPADLNAHFFLRFIMFSLLA